MSTGNQTALLVIDVQIGMYGFPEFQPYRGAEVIETINTLITKARQAHAPVIFVRHAGNGDGHPLEIGSHGHDIDPRLARLNTDPVIDKSRCVSFRETDLNDHLVRLGIKTLVIGGLQTDHCVDSAVRIAVDKGYDVIIAKGAHSTFETEYLSAEKIIIHHETVWAESFGAVISVDDISFESEAA